MQVAATVNSRTFTHTVVIALRGHVDESGSHQLHRELINALMHQRRRHIVVDFARVTSLDATAVGALIAAHDSAPDMRLTLTLRNPNVGIAAELAEHGLPTSPGRSSPGRGNASRANPSRTNPDRGNPSRTNPDRGNPSRTNPDRGNPGRSNPGPGQAIR
jgi:anti-anti-sigma factor